MSFLPVGALLPGQEVILDVNAFQATGGTLCRCIADGDIAAGEPVHWSGAPTDGTLPVSAADGAESAVEPLAGIAAHDAEDGAEVYVVTKGLCTAAKQTGTAWASGQSLAIGTGKNLVPSTQDLDGTKVQVCTIGFAVAAAGSADATGTLWVNPA